MPSDVPPPPLISYFEITGNVSPPDLWTINRAAETMELRHSEGGCPGIQENPLDVDLTTNDTLSLFTAIDDDPNYEISITGAVPGVDATELVWLDAVCPSARTAGQPVVILGPDPA